MSVKDHIRDMQVVKHYDPEMTVYSDGHTQTIPNFHLDGDGRMTLTYKKEISENDYEKIEFSYGKVHLGRVKDGVSYLQIFNRNDVKRFLDSVIVAPVSTETFVVTMWDDNCFYLERTEALGFLRQYCHLFEPNMGIIPEK